MVFALLASTRALAADVAIPGTYVDTFSYRWYIEGRLGLPVQKSYGFTGLGVPATYRPDTGWFGAVAAGVQFHPNWRAELAFSYTTGKDGNVRLLGINIPHRGRVNVYSFGVNGYYVFDVSPWFQPFVGAGLGFATYDVNRLGAVGGVFVINGSRTTPVLSLHAGVDVPVTEQVTLTARYTMAHTGSMTFPSVPAGIPMTRNAATDHIFSGGVRVYFN
jgi:opacity protein-like surface antigen